jgi:HD-like signal output (HDOD) protein/prolyl-tRNA editing enzyme YbaK/EbsC (Cys-tRNA(Pro) deacylase)
MKNTREALSVDNEAIVTKFGLQKMAETLDRFLKESTAIASLVEVNPVEINSVLEVQKIESVLLQDNEGVIQVIYPKSCFIDLQSISDCLGRNFQMAQSKIESNLIQKVGGNKVVSLPKLLGMPCLVDSRVLNLPQVILEVEPHVSLTMQQADFAKVIQDMQVAEFAHPIAKYAPKIEVADDRGAIVQAVTNFTALRVKQRLEDTLEIPPMPDSAAQIIKLRVDPNATISELVKIVERDPSLAAQVVSWAASPYYGAVGKIKSVQDAILRVLGFDLVVNLALGLSLGRSLKLPTNGPRNSMPYWERSVFSATLVESLVKQMSPKNRPSMGLAYLCGLLHNFGFLLLSFVFPPHFIVISRNLEINRHVHPSVIENFLIGVTREQVSSWLMEIWHMPEEIGVALRWQHLPDYVGTHFAYPNLLFLVNKALDLKSMHRPLSELLQYRNVMERLGLDPSSVLSCIEGVFEKEREISSMAKSFGS